MKKNLKILLAATWFITLFASLNINMFNLGIPQIKESFAINSSQASWISSGYVLFTGLSAITFGKLADLFPTRKLMTAGVCLLLLGSLIGLVSQQFWMVIVSRMLQGVGTGAFPSVGIVMAAKFYPADRRGLLIGIIMSSITFGAGLGPLAGGYLAQIWGWRALFSLSLISVLGLPFLWRFTPRETVEGGHLDAVGAVWCILSALFILLGINTTPWLFILAGIFLVLFWFHSTRQKSPFLNLAILRNGAYSLNLCMIFLVNLTHVAAFFVLPLMLMDANHLSESLAGVIIFPGAVLSAIAGGPIGQAVDKFGPIRLIQLATVLMALTFLFISTFVGHSPIWIMIAVFLEYVAYSISQVSISSFASKSLPPQEVGAGMGLFNLILYFGMALGTALFGRFLTINMGKWNILNDSPFFSYSNAFLVLGLLILIVFVISAIVKRIPTPQSHD